MSAILIISGSLTLANSISPEQAQQIVGLLEDKLDFDETGTFDLEDSVLYINVNQRVSQSFYDRALDNLEGFVKEYVPDGAVFLIGEEENDIAVFGATDDIKHAARLRYLNDKAASIQEQIALHEQVAGTPMDTKHISWNYDPATGAIRDAGDRELICTTADGVPAEYGRVIAAAPAVRALATELQSVLDWAHGAFEGEEDSVQDEHRSLMRRMKAMLDRANFVLGETDQHDPAALRASAAVLLAQAQHLDGKRAYIATHSHEYGQTGYLVWSPEFPTDRDIRPLLISPFEPHLGEELTVANTVTAAELTGAAKPDDGDYEDISEDDSFGCEIAPR